MIINAEAGLSSHSVIYEQRPGDYYRQQIIYLENAKGKTEDVWKWYRKKQEKKEAEANLILWSVKPKDIICGSWDSR